MDKFLLKRLEQWGCDITSARERLCGDEDLLIECICSFKNGTETFELQSAVEKRDYTNAFHYAHTIKGVVANLELTPLYTTISIVVEALRMETYDTLEPSFQNYLSKYQEFCQLI